MNQGKPGGASITKLISKKWILIPSLEKSSEPSSSKQTYIVPRDQPKQLYKVCTKIQNGHSNFIDISQFMA